MPSATTYWCRILTASTVRDGPRFLISRDGINPVSAFARCHALAICPAGRVRNGRDGWPRRYRTCETNAGLYSAPVRGDPRLSVGCTGECADCVRVVPWGNDLDGERLLVQRDHPIVRLGVRVSSLSH